MGERTVRSCFRRASGGGGEVLEEGERGVGVARRQPQHHPLRLAHLQPQRACRACAPMEAP